jgi:exosome complex component RRP4
VKTSAAFVGFVLPIPSSPPQVLALPNATKDCPCRGHGTQIQDERLVASVCGVIDRVNKLVTVRTLHRRYAAEIGDVVVGRVSEVVAKRWRIDLQSRQECHLLLSAVTLPGGVQRRRTAEDELNMRSVFTEGDLVSVS